MTKADLVDKIHAKAGLGEECLIPASRVVKFTPGKALKEAVK